VYSGDPGPAHATERAVAWPGEVHFYGHVEPGDFPATSFHCAEPLCDKMVEGKGTIDMPTGKLTKTIIEAAIAGFEAQKSSIDSQIAELRAMLTGSAETATGEAPAKAKTRKFSAAAIKRMREAQKLRWAKIKGEASPAPVKTPTEAAKTKGGITAAGRKALSIAMKKRWAAKKAARTKAA